MTDLVDIRSAEARSADEFESKQIGQDGTVKDPSEFEAVNICPLCKGLNADLLFWNYDRLYKLPGKFGTYTCRGCGLIRISPRPIASVMSEYYPEEYAAYNHSFVAPEGRGGWTSFARRIIRHSVFARMGYDTGSMNTFHRLLGMGTYRAFVNRATYGYGEIIPRFIPNGRVLEVGCGDGRFLAILKHLGWEVQGIDLSPVAARRAKKDFDIDVFVGQVDQADFGDRMFDHIRLSHVLEHFYDPVETLRQLKALLKPGGTIFIEVPNAAGAEAEIVGQQWYGWDAPRHLFMFDPSTLSSVIETAGLNVTRLETLPCHTFEWAVTFQKEEERGSLLSERPAELTAAESAEIRKKTERAKAIYAADRRRGERILCWVRDDSSGDKVLRMARQSTDQPAPADLSPTLLFPAITIERRWPMNLDMADVGDFDYEQRFDTRYSFLKPVGEAWISSDSILYKRGKLVEETLAHPTYRSYYRLKHLVKKALTSRKVFLPRGAHYLLVTDSWSDSHFHWLTDAMPKLLALGVDRLREFTLLLPDTEYMRRIATESIRLAGFDFAGIIFMSDSEFYRASDVSYITRLSKSGSMHDPLMKELQSLYTKNAGDRKRMIYISRRKARIRYVLNDDEVSSCLRDYGFETPLAEDLSLEDQIELFNSAKTILGIHGAGLTNALFMKAGGTVVELRKREGPIGNVCYWHLADSLDHRYYYFNGDSDRDHILSGTGCNLTISIPDLEERVLKPIFSADSTHQN